jgi:cystathionine beta-lyase/cystathionine gamma-synthase
MTIPILRDETSRRECRGDFPRMGTHYVHSGFGMEQIEDKANHCRMAQQIHRYVPDHQTVENVNHRKVLLVLHLMNQSYESIASNSQLLTAVRSVELQKNQIQAQHQEDHTTLFP